MDTSGDTFQKNTQYQRHQMAGKHLDWASKPNTYKDYPIGQTIDLPTPRPLSEMSLFETLKQRRSIRHYPTKPMTKDILSYLLWASTGISQIHGEYAFRTAPSAGALYPIETYIVVNHVHDIASGVYHYNIKNHTLDVLKQGDYAKAIAQAALNQKMCLESPVVFVWSAIFQRMKWKYDQRAYRYIYLDAGHMAQNLALAAVSLGLGSCQIGALYDDEANLIIDVDGTEESVIYMSVVG